MRKNPPKLPPPEATKAKTCTSCPVADGYFCTPQNVETMILDLKQIMEMLTAPACMDIGQATTEGELTNIHKYVSEDDGTMSKVLWYIVAPEIVIGAQVRLIMQEAD